MNGRRAVADASAQRTAAIAVSPIFRPRREMYMQEPRAKSKMPDTAKYLRRRKLRYEYPSCWPARQSFNSVFVAFLEIAAQPLMP